MSVRIATRLRAVPDAEPLVREAVEELLGYDPGPLFHSCPECGSVEHGRPYVDAPVLVSVAHDAGLTLVAVVATDARRAMRRTSEPARDR